MIEPEGAEVAEQQQATTLVETELVEGASAQFPHSSLFTAQCKPLRFQRPFFYQIMLLSY